MSEPDGMRMITLVKICAAITYIPIFIFNCIWIGDTEWLWIGNVIGVTAILGTIAFAAIFCILIELWEHEMETYDSIEARKAQWRRVFAYKLHRDYLTNRPIWLEVAWRRSYRDSPLSRSEDQWRKGK